jgi:hypothetical protein
MDAMNGSEHEFHAKARGPVSARPVVFEGAVIGYLWFTRDPLERAASFLPVPEAASGTAEAARVWKKRLREAARSGLSPEEAVLDWVGAPVDPEAGGIPDGATAREAENTEALLRDIAGETGAGGGEEPPVPEPPLVFDRWSDEALAPVLLGRSFNPVAEGPVIYFPVTRNDALIGYLWASEADDASDFQPLLPPSVEANVARGWWTMEHVRQRGEGLEPLEALRSNVGTVNDPTGGRVDAEAAEARAESLEALRRIARA